MFDSLCIKHIDSNPYYPQGNQRIENIHNFPQGTIPRFTYGSELKWDDAPPLATYCYNIVPSADNLESPFYLAFGHDLLE